MGTTAEKGMTPSITDELACVRRELKQYRSILAMLKGNTDDRSLKRLEERWLLPLQERIEDLEATRCSSQTGANVVASEAPRVQ